MISLLLDDEDASEDRPVVIAAGPRDAMMTIFEVEHRAELDDVDVGVPAGNIHGSTVRPQVDGDVLGGREAGNVDPVWRHGHPLRRRHTRGLGVRRKERHTAASALRARESVGRLRR